MIKNAEMHIPQVVREAASILGNNEKKNKKKINVGLT